MEDIISLRKVAKSYKLYKSSNERMKEALHPLKKKYHEEFYALSEIDLNVKRGEILGIVGKNGSGKSTLLKVISGILTPTRGTVSVKGKVTPLLELGSGFNPAFTGVENVHFRATMDGFPQEEIKDIVKDIIEFAEIGVHIDHPVKTYSSGMKARLAFAVSTAIQPEILILDEILSVGDALFQRKAFSRMEKLINDGDTTVLFVSHNPQSITKICTSAILLHDGKVDYEGTPKNVVNEYHKLLFGQGSSSNRRIAADKSKELSKNQKVNVEKKVLPTEPKEKNDRELYLPELISKSEEIIIDGPVRICGISVCNEKNTKVNQILSQKTYTLMLEIDTDIDAEIQYSATIRDKMGYIIAGYNQCNLVRRELLQVSPGKTYIKLNFRAFFTSNLYYVSASLYDSTGQAIYGVRDAIVFKVVNDKLTTVGYVDAFE